MVSLLKILLFFLFFYIIFKIVRNLLALVAKPKDQKMPFVSKDEQGSTSVNIKSEDIIDADFEEIKPSKSDKSEDS